ncbi:hypothetical protein D3C76_733790 [compost metagenome]
MEFGTERLPLARMLIQHIEHFAPEGLGPICTGEHAKQVSTTETEYPHVLLATPGLHLDHAGHGWRKLVSMTPIECIELTNATLKGCITLITPFPIERGGNLRKR